MPELTVGRQLTLWQRACGLAGPPPAELLALLGLEELLHRPIRSLSGGTAQRVSIALALLARPKILLMDEATAGLDEAYVPRLLGWLEGFLAAGGSLVWCSHRQEELSRLCGAVLRLQDGRLMS